jgi:hypothetical protein
MTYNGHNFDIVTGVLALIFAAAVYLGRIDERVQRAAAAGFNLVGLGLLLTVASIAVRSTPGPLRTYDNEPPVLLVAYAPYTWILSICVAGALFGHVLLFRWLAAGRAAAQRA